MFSAPRREPISHRLEGSKTPRIGRLDPFSHGCEERHFILNGDRM